MEAEDHRIEDFNSGREFKRLEDEISEEYKRLNGIISLSSKQRVKIPPALKEKYEKYMSLARQYNLPESETQEVAGMYNEMTYTY